MDSGSPKFVYNDKTYQIADETDFFAVDKDFKHIASFKERDAAFEYVAFLKFKPKDTMYFPDDSQNAI